MFQKNVLESVCKCKFNNLFNVLRVGRNIWPSIKYWKVHRSSQERFHVAKFKTLCLLGVKSRCEIQDPVYLLYIVKKDVCRNFKTCNSEMTPLTSVRWKDMKYPMPVVAKWGIQRSYGVKCNPDNISHVNPQGYNEFIYN